MTPQLVVCSGPSQPHDAFAVAIQRARDFGIPSYPQARRALALSVPTSFDALDTTPQIRELLRAAYANNIRCFLRLCQCSNTKQCDELVSVDVYH